MVKCTRRRRDGQRCQRDAAEWPGQRQGLGQPDLDWPDLPRSVACWTHLTDTEREMCLQARARRDEASREHRAREAAAREAAGIPPPQPVAMVERDPPVCTGECISEAAAWDRAHPGQFHDHSDGAMMSCATCHGDVCCSCGRAPVPGMGMICDQCGEADAAALAADADWEPPPDPRDDLNRLIGRIVHTGNLAYATVHARVNKAMGVGRRREADPQAIQEGIAFVHAWLEALASDEPDPLGATLDDPSTGIAAPTRREPRLRIVPTPAAGPRWQAQLDLIRASGAVYDAQAHLWWLSLSTSAPDWAALQTLFTAAREHQTQITVEMFPP